MTRFGEISPLLNDLKNWQFLRVYLVSDIILSQLWQILNVIGQIFIDLHYLNGQILKNNPAIWPHCPILSDDSFILLSRTKFELEPDRNRCYIIFLPSFEPWEMVERIFWDYDHFWQTFINISKGRGQCDQKKKSPNVYKSCLKMISLQK